MRCSPSDEGLRVGSRALRGSAAEVLATRFLEGAGLVLVERNVRCRFGEIDIVARDGDCVVFVEVRLRASSRFGGAAASVDAGKQRRLIAAARWYLSRHPRLADHPCRFDVVALAGVDGPVDWLRDAFRVDG